MPKDGGAKTKAVAGKTTKPATAKSKPKTNSLKFPTRPRPRVLGGAVLPKKRDVGRFVKWPRYVRLQRQKKIIQERLKVPPALNQFRSPAEANVSKELFKMLEKYKPEDAKAKKARLLQRAKDKAEGKTIETKPTITLAMGLVNVTSLVETKKAKLVVIACDVDPIELVVWLPALCRKMDVPYMIVNNKGRLGQLVHKKTASCLALTKVNKEDEAQFAKIQSSAKALYNDNKDLLRKWGGGEMGERTKLAVQRHEAAVAAERAKKEKMMAA
jgi:large subunit ribosomal protein L7Ae